MNISYLSFVPFRPTGESPISGRQRTANANSFKNFRGVLPIPDKLNFNVLSVILCCADTR